MRAVQNGNPAELPGSRYRLNLAPQDGLEPPT